MGLGLAAQTCRMPSSALKASPAKGESVCSLLYLWWVWCSSLLPATKGLKLPWLPCNLVTCNSVQSVHHGTNIVTSLCTLTPGEAHASMAECHGLGELVNMFRHFGALMLCNPATSIITQYSSLQVLTNAERQGMCLS